MLRSAVAWPSLAQTLHRRRFRAKSCDKPSIHEPFSALRDEPLSGALRGANRRVPLLIALLAPVVVLAAGIASRWLDPAWPQRGERENSDVGRPIQG
jgi:hypothetical protein